MVTILDLPNQIIVHIVSFLGFTIDDNTGDYYPNSMMLYATCKRFSFLSTYCYSHALWSEYDIFYKTVDITGKPNGPMYSFLNSFNDGYPPSGYCFYRNGKPVGTFCYTIMPASNIGFDIVNGKFYSMIDDTNKIILKAHMKLQDIDRENYIDGYVLNKISNEHPSICLGMRTKATLSNIYYPNKQPVIIIPDRNDTEITGYKFMKTFYF